MKKIQLLSGIIALSTLVLVGLGGFVRATGAGLACPDWPLCFERVIPPTLTDGVGQEFFHRVLAGLVSLLTVYLALLCYRQKASLPQLWKLAIALLIILAVQVILGGLTVILLLNPFIVTSHLALGTLFLLLVSLLGLETRLSREKIQAKAIQHAPARWWYFFLAVLVYLQILLGGFVGSSGASLACTELPLCSGAFFRANMSGPEFYHMLHRTLGYTLGALFLISIAVFRGAIRKAFTHMGMLVLIQIALGLANVYYRIPVSITVIHLVVAQMLLFGLVLLYRFSAAALRR